jgi:hypothetical protein
MDALLIVGFVVLIALGVRRWDRRRLAAHRQRGDSR